jgi:hypothetical protein
VSISAIDRVLDRVLFATAHAEQPRDDHGRWVYVGGAHGVNYGPTDVRSADLSDVPPELITEGREWSKRIKPYEKTAIYRYTMDDFQLINERLRACPETLDCLNGHERDMAQDIDAAIRQFPNANKPITTWRALRCSTPEKAKAISDILATAHKIGATVKMAGFGSASLDAEFAANRANQPMLGKPPGIVLEIRSPRGAFIKSASAMYDEEEVLHPHNDIYKVVEVQDNVKFQSKSRNDRAGKLRSHTVAKVFVLEAVPDAPPPLTPAAFAEANSSEPRDERGRWAYQGGPHGIHYTPADVRSAGKQDVPPELDLTAQKWVEKLRYDERDAVTRYSDDGSDELNRSMRKCPDTLDCLKDPVYRKWADNLDAAIRSFPQADKPVTTWRAVRSRSAEKQAGFVEMFRAAHASGATVTLSGFNSASLDPSLAARWATQKLPALGINKPVGIVLEIRSPRGAYIRQLSANPEELEVLHPHNDTYKVVDIHENVRFEQKFAPTPINQPVIKGWTPPVAQKTTVPLVIVLEAVGDGPPPLPPPPKEAAFAEFDPAQHPRAADGKFGDGGERPLLEPVVRADNELRGRLDAWADKLTYGQRDAITHYTENGYVPLNEGLRKCPETGDCLGSYKDEAKKLDAAIRAFPPHDPPLTTYRGLMSGMPSAEARAHITKIEDGLKAALATGGTFKVDGFGSATLNPTFAAKWTTHHVSAATDELFTGIVLEMKSSRGAFLGHTSDKPEEMEVLHPHGDRYKVTGVREQEFRTDSGGTARRKVYTLEAIHEPPAPFGGGPAKFAFNPDLHPHGEHGRWASATGGESAEPSPESSLAPLASVDKAPPALVRESQKWWRSLTPEQRNDLYEYTDSAFMDLNKQLRKHPEGGPALGFNQFVAARMDAALRKCPPLAEPLVSYRGLQSSRHKIDDRIKHLTHIEDGLRAAIATGSPVTLNGFTSASLDPSLAARWSTSHSPKKFPGVVLEIKSRRGVLLDPAASLHMDELEVLHTHGEQFKVTGVREQPYEDGVGNVVTRRTYTLEAVPDQSPPLPLDDARFGAFDPAEHPKGEDGKWISVPKLTSDSLLPADNIPAEPQPRYYGPDEQRTWREENIPKQLKRDGVKWADSLNAEENTTINDYTGSLYQIINPILREHPTLEGVAPEYLRKITVIDEAIRRFPQQKVPVTTFRGINTSDPDKLKTLEAGFRDAFTTGTPVTLPGFSSASLNPNIAIGEEFSSGVVLELHSPRGAYIPQVSGHYEEREVLHTHGERFKVIAIHENAPMDEFTGQHARVYVMEAVDEPPPPLPRRMTLEGLAAERAKDHAWDTHYPATPTEGVPFALDAKKHMHGTDGKFVSGGGEASASNNNDLTEVNYRSYGPDDVRKVVTLNTVPSEVAARGWKLAAELTPEEKSSIEAYTDNAYKNINAPLRSNPESPDYSAYGEYADDWKNAAKAIASVIEKSGSYARPVTTWRAIRPAGDEKRQQLEELFNSALLSGKPLAMPGFGSATLNPEVATAYDRGLVLEIRSRKGAYVAPVSSHTGELEIILPHNARYRVVAHHPEAPFASRLGPRNSLRNVYVLEAVDEPTPAVNFAFDPDLHPKGADGRWASKAGPGSVDPHRQYGDDDIRPLSVTAGELPMDLRVKADKWGRSLTDAEKDAVENYASMGFLKLNRSLASAKGDADKIDSSFMPLHDNLTSAIKKFGQADPPVTVWRGASLRKEKAETLMNAAKVALETGCTLTLPCFQSCSFNPAIARHIMQGDAGKVYEDGHGVTRSNVMLEIKARTGAWIGGTSLGANEENEWLSPPTATYKVVGIKKVKFGASSNARNTQSQTVLQLEEVPTPAPAPAKFAFDPALHPHGEHGHWAPVEGEKAGVSAPPEMLERVTTTPPEIAGKADDWAATLTHDQRDSIGKYTGDDYDKINKALRRTPETWGSLSPWHLKQAVAIDSAIRAFPKFETPVTTYRGVASNMGMRSRPKLQEIEAGLKAALASGAPITMNGFASATLDPALAGYWATAGNVFHGVVLEIKSRRGAYIGGLSDLPDELEILHPHGAQYKVVASREQLFDFHPRQNYIGREGKGNSRTVYTLEAVDADPPPPPPIAIERAATFNVFDPALHPHGEHGHWASTAGEAVSPPEIYTPVRAVPPQLESDARQWGKNTITDREAQAVVDYTHTGYYGVNTFLRSATPEILADTMAHPATINSLYLIAASRIDSALRKFPPRSAPMTTFRGVAVSRRAKADDIIASYDAALASGAPVTMKGFGSATLNPSFAADWSSSSVGKKLVLEIHSRHGAYIAPISMTPREMEVLHPHGAQYKVTGVRDQKYELTDGTVLNFPTYTLEEVLDAPAEKLPNPIGFAFNPGQPRDHGRWANAAGTGSPADSAKVTKVGTPLVIDGSRYTVEDTDSDDAFPVVIAKYELKDGHLFYTGRNGSEGVVSGTRKQMQDWCKAVDRELTERPLAQTEIRSWTPADGGEHLIERARATAAKTANLFGLDPGKTLANLKFGTREADYGLGGESTGGVAAVVNAHKDSPHAFNFPANVSRGEHFTAHEVLHTAYSANPEAGHKAMDAAHAAALKGRPASLYAGTNPHENLMEAGAAYVTAPDELRKHNPALYDAVDAWSKQVRKADFAFNPEEPRDHGKWVKVSGGESEPPASADHLAALGTPEYRDAMREQIGWAPSQPPMRTVLKLTPEQTTEAKDRCAALAARLGRKLTQSEIKAEMAFPNRNVYGGRLNNFLRTGDPDKVPPPLPPVGELPLEKVAAAAGAWTYATHKTDGDFAAAYPDVYHDVLGKMDLVKQYLPGANVRDVVGLAGWQPGDDSPRVGTWGDALYLHSDTFVWVGRARIIRKDSQVLVTPTMRGPYINLQEFNIDPGFQGEGTATKAIAAMVVAAQRVGAWSIHTSAVGCGKLSAEAEGNKKYRNGYYTWPMLGFDRTFNEDDQKYHDAIPEPFRQAKTLNELLRMPGGPAAWKDYGYSVSCELRISQPDSPGMKVLPAYLAARQSGFDKKAAKHQEKVAKLRKQMEEGNA